jgi:hypothetical protein
MFKIFGFTAQSSTVTVFGYWDRANAMSVKRRIKTCLKLNQTQLHQAHNQPLNRRKRPLDMDVGTLTAAEETFGRRLVEATRCNS